MSISFDFSFLSNLFTSSPNELLLKAFFYGGWIPIAIAFLLAARELWFYYIGNQWAAQQKFVLLAIDIPRGNSESLKTVENLFTYLAGAHGSLNIIDKYWIGKFQLGFSFEIVSIDGYTQFLIHTPVGFRNLVESAVYSVYPDAEISEVNDYTDNVPHKYPDNEYDLWGGEFIQVLSDAYPIKTYPEFMDASAKSEVAFKDPMAAFMDLNSTLVPGEQFWFQLLVKPTDFSWTKRADEEVSKILKEKVAKKSNFLDDLVDVTLGSVVQIFSLIGSILSGPSEKKEEKAEVPLKMMDLKPKEKKKVESIQKKASKLGFECKIRVIYVAKKNVMNKPKVVNGFVGYMKQFIDQDLNNFKPDMDKTVTSVNFLFKDSRLKERQNKVINGYIGRSGSTGRSMKVLNIEELATLWHFPIEAVVKAPLIQKAPGRKSEPPMSLPLEEYFMPEEDGKRIAESIFEAEVLNKAPEARNDQDSDAYQSKKSTAGLPEFFEENENDNNNSRGKNDAPGNLPFV